MRDVRIGGNGAVKNVDIMVIRRSVAAIKNVETAMAICG
jgi:hypothetical protein